MSMMVPLQLSHFQSFILFALIISLAFGTLGRRHPLERVKYATWSFAMFVAVGIALAWLMYPFSR
jgi:ABC-type Mn2+/Zn2+ transport system permease subunit